MCCSLNLLQTMHGYCCQATNFKTWPRYKHFGGSNRCYVAKIIFSGKGGCLVTIAKQKYFAKQHVLVSMVAAVVKSDVHKW